MAFGAARTAHARNEDLNHSSQFYGISNYKQSWSPTGSPMLSFQGLGRPLTSIDSQSSSVHSDDGGNSTLKRLSAISLELGQSTTAASDSDSNAGTSVSTTSTLVMATCVAWSLPVLTSEDAFVWALGNVWHHNCFKCKVSII